MGKRPDSDEITSFILNEIDVDPIRFVRRAAAKFGVSRQAVQGRVRNLVKSGVLLPHGETRGRRYELTRQVVFAQTMPVSAGLAEDVVFANQIAPLLEGVRPNVRTICNYGFTEMLNNVIDHSASDTVALEVSRSPAVLEFQIADRGIGIFRKIKEALGLSDERQSLVELSKGKMTTDRSRHSGEGVFFTSRAFDRFSILSGELFVWHRADHDDWLVENRPAYHAGTCVTMRIVTCSPTKIKDVFDRFSTPRQQDSFARTQIPVALAQFGDGNLVSRSQAKRVVTRFEDFEEVVLDFERVQTIGQAFADEIFRVFRHQKPQTSVRWIRATAEVEGMIRRAIAGYEQDVRMANVDPESKI